jgi:hypothetical protein
MPFMFGVLEDVHSFAVGSVRGLGSETRVRFGNNNGITLGTYNFDSFEIGYDAFRYSGVEVFAQDSGLKLHGYVLVPNLDFRVFVGPNRLATAIGTSASGFRIANCALTGCFEASLRVLTVNAWYTGDFHNASFALSLGAGLSLGIKL